MEEGTVRLTKFIEEGMLNELVSGSMVKSGGDAAKRHSKQLVRWCGTFRPRIVTWCRCA